MKSSLKRLTAVAGTTCAILGAGPAVVLAATTPGAPTMTTASPLPGQSCSVNQGLFPGIPNLGPTGPLGPLGSSGPVGGNNQNLPCGTAAFNVGPTGPLGPGGALGSVSSPSQQTGTAAQAAPASQAASAPSANPARKAGHANRTTRKHPSRARTHKHAKVQHGRARSHNGSLTHHR
jgi:hypothetical protein